MPPQGIPDGTVVRDTEGVMVVTDESMGVTEEDTGDLERDMGATSRNNRWRRTSRSRRWKKITLSHRWRTAHSSNGGSIWTCEGGGVGWKWGGGVSENDFLANLLQSFIFCFPIYYIIFITFRRVWLCKVLFYNPPTPPRFLSKDKQDRVPYGFDMESVEFYTRKCNSRRSLILISYSLNLCHVR